MPGQQGFQPGWQDRLFGPGNPQIQRIHLLQHHPFFRVVQVAPAHPHPVPAGQGEIALGQLRLVGVHRLAAEGIKGFLQLIPGGPQSGQLFRAAGQLSGRAKPSRKVHPDRTLCPQPHFMHLLCSPGSHPGQRPAQKGRQCLHRLLILVHLCPPPWPGRPGLQHYMARPVPLEPRRRRAGGCCSPARRLYAAGSSSRLSAWASMVSAKMAYPRVGSLTSTWVTAPASLPF